MKPISKWDGSLNLEKTWIKPQIKIICDKTADRNYGNELWKKTYKKTCIRSWGWRGILIDVNVNDLL